MYLTKENINIFLKTSVNLSEEIISFHRIKMIEELNKISKKNNLNSLIQGERLSQKDFIRTMKDSMIMPSPFGWENWALEIMKLFTMEHAYLSQAWIIWTLGQIFLSLMKLMFL